MRTDRMAALVLLAAGNLALSTAATAAQHSVSPQDARAALVAAGSQRAADLETLNSVLSSPAARAASQKGVDVATARVALPTLTDQELRDLAARVQALDRDPASGLSKDANDLLVIFLVVVIVILVLQAVN
jgi:hypothetical protein